MNEEESLSLNALLLWRWRLVCYKDYSW